MKGLLGIWLVICVCACTSKDVCHVQGRIEGIKDDVEIAVLRQVAGFQYDTVMNVSMQGGQFQFDLPGEYSGKGSFLCRERKCTGLRSRGFSILLPGIGYSGK